MLKKFTLSLCYILCAFALSSCNTDVKRLGDGPEENDTDPVDVEDNFVINFAFRETNTDAGTGGANNPTVQIQGVGDTNSPGSFANLCGSDGTNCTCLFIDADDSTNTASDTTIAINDTFNSISCDIPATSTPSDFEFVRVRQKINSDDSSADRKQSSFITIKTTLELSDILGDLPPENVRKIFRYSCTEFFIEGEGFVPLGQSDCNINTMVLRFLTIKRNFYLFSQNDTPTTTNFNERLTQDILYNEGNGDGLTCGLTLTRVRCDQGSELRFGLYGEFAGQFSLGLILTSGIGPQATDGFQGAAATTDDDLNCPPGLVRARVFQAVPPSIVSNNSNYQNQDGSANDNLIEPIGEFDTSTFTFDIARQDNDDTRVCTDGICQLPNGGVNEKFVSVNYEALFPVVCVIPASLL